MNLEDLRDFVNELHIRIDYNDYLTLINMIDEIDTKPTCKEDFRDWIIDNWEVVEDNIEKSIDKIAKEYSVSGDNFNIEDSVDKDVLIEEISDNLKQGLLNVIDTYE